jgi:hypothetical protein
MVTEHCATTLTAYEKHFPQKLIKNCIDKNRSPCPCHG